MQTRDQLLKELGERIRAIRTEKGLTQVELANAIGKDQQVIQRLEAGRYNPSYFYLAQVASGLEISIHELFRTS